MRSKTKILFVFLAISLAQLSFPQTKEIDSLIKLLENHYVNDTTKTNLLNKISTELLKKDLKLSKSYSQKANALSKKIKYILSLIHI